MIAAARAAASDFLGVLSDEPIFGANMTTLNFQLSRSLAKEMQPGDDPPEPFSMLTERIETPQIQCAITRDRKSVV